MSAFLIANSWPLDAPFLSPNSRALSRAVTDAANSPRFAPKQISQMPGASGYSKKEFKSAMERLFGAGRIVVGTAFGADRHKVKAIVRTDQDMAE